MQGLSFVVTIAGMIYHNVKEITDEAELSLKEIMREMKKLIISHNGNKRLIENKIKVFVRRLQGWGSIFPGTSTTKLYLPK